jgi:hypothetical protein
MVYHKQLDALGIINYVSKLSQYMNFSVLVLISSFSTSSWEMMSVN